MKCFFAAAAFLGGASALQAQTIPAPSASPTASPAGPEAPGPTAPAAAAADAYYPADVMALARDGLRREHGGATYSMLLIDIAEISVNKEAGAYGWDGQFWYGGDRDRLFVKSEGAGSTKSVTDHAEVQALWSRAVDPYFSVQTGIRYDLRPRPGRAYAVLGVQGVAPYWIDVEAHLFLSNRGELLSRVKLSHDMRLTQRLVLQPRVEAELSAQMVRFAEMGPGLSDVELGLRLRYELRREFAPYIGISHEASVGSSVALVRAAGRDASKTSLVLGIRTYF
ncbi:copper resistance protein B [Sphingomonas sp. So64.6b]|uniref:copper resistance protein B n=1 Tax=Sphingomonas sp. So64.6b TaxID=2997354 RepID=UPI0015FF278D|nr:copper resistance protein B [Sphingomonas sp. So64.6b]QNA85516.1 copper resistance protein B [Sphingomonas sp. So64.6b]